MSERRQVLLRIDPAVHDALIRWANDEFRSVNAQIEMLLRRALTDAGRMPKQAAPLPKRGRPPASGSDRRAGLDSGPGHAGLVTASRRQRQAGAPRRAPA